MEYDKLFWVLCLTLFLAVGLNVMIYVAFRGKQSEGMAETLHRMSKGVRNPWEAEDAALDELSGLVAEFKGKESDPEENESQMEQRVSNE